MNDIIYVNERTGQIVPEGYPNSEPYIKLHRMGHNELADKYHSQCLMTEQYKLELEKAKLMLAEAQRKYEGEHAINESLRTKLDEARMESCSQAVNENMDHLEGGNYERNK